MRADRAKDDLAFEVRFHGEDADYLPKMKFWAAAWGKLDAKLSRVVA